MGKGSSRVTIGYNYFFGIHMGVCRGPVDALVEIKVGDKTAWPLGHSVRAEGGCHPEVVGTPPDTTVVQVCTEPYYVTTDEDPPITSSGVTTINARELFGGEEKEGGIEGQLDIMMGEPTQGVNPRLAAMLNSPLVSGFRGMFTLFYDGLISSMSAYPKPWKFRVRRALQGWDGDPWYPETAVIELYRTGEIPSSPPVASEEVTLVARVEMNGTNDLVFIPADPARVVSVDYILVPLAPEDQQNFDSPAILSWGIFGDEIHITTLGASLYSNVYMANIYYTYDRPLQPPPVSPGLSASRARIAAMNPVHIIYEVLTNRDWGRGLPRTALDDDLFRKSADITFDEGFGLCIKWTREDTIEAFLQQILDHCGGVLYTSRETGLISLRMIRNAALVENVPILTRSTGIIEVQEDDGSLVQSLINEVIVTYTDAITGTPRQVRVQNTGAALSSPGIFSKSFNYPGIPTPELATRVAQRDLKVNGTPLRRFKFVMDRRGYQLTPGSVFAYSDVDRNLTNALMRVGRIEDHTDVDGKIIVTTVQDVFGLSETTFVGSQQVAPPVVSSTPVPAPFSFAFEAPYIELLRNMNAADFAALTGDEGYLIVVASRPTVASEGFSIHTGWETTGYEVRGLGEYSPIGRLQNAVGPSDTTAVLVSTSDASRITIGQAFMLDEEICRLDSWTPSSGAIVFSRGCMDTVPVPHAANTVAWFFQNLCGRDPTTYAAFTDLNARALVRTSLGQLAPAQATPIETGITARHFRPYPPANVLVDGNPWYQQHICPGEFTLTWLHRNRVTQADILIPYDSSSVTPEAGTEYIVTLYDYADGPFTTQIRSTTGITGDTYTYDNADWIADGSVGEIQVVVSSIRDSVECFYPYIAIVRMSLFGFRPDPARLTAQGHTLRGVSPAQDELSIEGHAPTVV